MHRLTLKSNNTLTLKTSVLLLTSPVFQHLQLCHLLQTLVWSTFEKILVASTNTLCLFQQESISTKKGCYFSVFNNNRLSAIKQKSLNYHYYFWHNQTCNLCRQDFTDPHLSFLLSTTSTKPFWRSSSLRQQKRKKGEKQNHYIIFARNGYHNKYPRFDN